MRKKLKAIVAFGLIFALSGCGRTYEKAPELIEPLTAQKQYLPCEYGNVGSLGFDGNMQIVQGIVAPTEQCYFWDESVKIDSINVNVGDYVKVGDVLATVDAEALQEEIDDLNQQILYYNSLNTLKENKYNYDKRVYELKQANNIETDMSMEEFEENHRYESAVNQYEIKFLNQQLSKKSELVSDTKIVATTEGYVTYIKDISEAAYVNPYENVVIVADYNKPFINISAIPCNQKIFEKYSSVYALYNKEYYDLEEIPYSKGEMLVMESRKIYADTRAKFAGGKKLPEIGESMSIFVRNGYKQNVLVINKDSLFQDSEGYYVLVKNGDNEEKRRIEVGQSDKKYVEVISGINEGELIYCEKNTFAKDDSVDENEIISEKEGNKIGGTEVKLDNNKQKKYCSEYEGIVGEVIGEANSEVEENTLICTIKTDCGASSVMEITNAIKNTKDDYGASNQEIDTAIDALNNDFAHADSINDANDNPDATATDAAKEINVDLYREQLANEIESLKIDKQINELSCNFEVGILNKQYSRMMTNNDGNGNIKIYSKEAGTLTNIKAAPGKKLSVDDELFTLVVPSDSKVIVYSEEELALNQKITFKNDGKTFEGKVVGYYGNPGHAKCYTSELEDRIVVTTNEGAKANDAYIIEATDKEFYKEQVFLYKYYCNVFKKDMADKKIGEAK